MPGVKQQESYISEIGKFGVLIANHLITTFIEQSEVKMLHSIQSFGPIDGKCTVENF